MTDPVGLNEIAERLDVVGQTARNWASGPGFPTPDYVSINNGPAWEWTTVLRWVGETGRARTPALRRDFERRFGALPVRPRKAGRPSRFTAAQLDAMATSTDDPADVARRFGVSEVYVYKLRQRHRMAST